jgi:predicted MFS family arabinose efflux permease
MPRATRAGSYRAVLSLPFALRTFVPALGGRLAYGLLPLALLFTVVDATGSYATAGLALAVFGLTGVTLPVKARLADRLGQRRTLPALALLCAAALTAAVTTDSPVGLVILIGLAGLAAPPLGPAMRATWRLLTLGTPLKERAYALDSVAEESLYLVGPLLAGLVIAVRPAADALLLTAFLLVAGTTGMVLPPPAGHTHRDESGAPPGRRRPLGTLGLPGLRLVLAVLLLAGAGVSVVYTAAAATARAHGQPGAAGWLEAAAALGGVLGGLAWGRRHHRHSRTAQLAGLLGGQALFALLAAAATGSLVGLGGALFAGGASVAPLFVVAYLAADDLAPDGHGTEAGTWVNVAANAGSAAGSAAAGLLVQSSGPAPAFLTAGLVLAAAAVVLLLRGVVSGMFRGVVSGRFRGGGQR